MKGWMTQGKGLGCAPPLPLGQASTCEAWCKATSFTLPASACTITTSPLESRRPHEMKRPKHLSVEPAPQGRSS